MTIVFPEWVQGPTECKTVPGTYIELTRHGIIRHRLEMPLEIGKVLYRTRIKNVERAYRYSLMKHTHRPLGIRK